MSLTWVVGGTSGIGLACAELLRGIEGHKVIASGHLVDVRSQDDLFTYLAEVGHEYKTKVDRLVYSAGINHLDWSQNIAPKAMMTLYEVNVVGLVNVLQLLPTVKRVVVVGSDAAWREMRTSVAYCASKAALHQAVRVIARERASDEFAINVVAPGMTDGTKMQEYVDQHVPVIRSWSKEDARAYEESQIPMKRRATVDEIAAVVVSVLLMPTNYLNGAIIPVNGGRG
jgi:NAD(P)-dependent dehydrogenase (short-subunit alcohol dehydrogenase family)